MSRFNPKTKIILLDNEIGITVGVRTLFLDKMHLVELSGRSNNLTQFIVQKEKINAHMAAEDGHSLSSHIMMAILRAKIGDESVEEFGGWQHSKILEILCSS